MKPPNNAVCHCYNGDAEDAARLYAQPFPESEVTFVSRAPADFFEGDVLVVS